MPRQASSNLSAIFKTQKAKPVFIPEVLTAIDESIGYETFLGEDNQVCVRIQMLDGSNTIEIPAEQLEGLKWITNAALSINSPRTRRSKAEIEAAAQANSGSKGQTPVSNNVMVNLMEGHPEQGVYQSVVENEDSETTEADETEKSEAPEPELAVTGTRSRRR